MTDENETEDTRLDDDGYSQRRFRRYQRAQERRYKDNKAEARFSRIMFSMTTISVGMAIGLAFMGYMVAVGRNGVKMDAVAVSRWSDPWIGSFSRLEVYSMGLLALVLLYFFWRARRKK